MLSADELAWWSVPETHSVQRYSKADSCRFGETFRVEPIDREDVRAHEDSFVIARISAERMDLVQYALKIGYVLCDTLTYWRGPSDIGQRQIPGYEMRPLTQGDMQKVSQMAAKAFAHYPSHYYNDPRTRPHCAEIYAEWASTLETGVVIEKDGEIVAWGQFSEPCELTLGGVDERHNGKGLYTAFAAACARWGMERGEKTIEISTQVTNLAVQKVWARLGLSPFRHVYTLHRWP